MQPRLLMERAADLGSFGMMKASGHVSPFTPLVLDHVYIKLDFQTKYENAQTPDDARGFLRSVARAAMAAHEVAEQHGGVLLEVQGSLLHVGLPQSNYADYVGSSPDNALAFTRVLHAAYRLVFDRAGMRVEGWRMSVDTGKTLVVAGRGAHGDDSWISLGNAANCPAKYLYSQLDRPEHSRQLKRFHVGIHNAQTGRWEITNLDTMPDSLYEAKAIAEQARSEEPIIEYGNAFNGSRRALAHAAPIGPHGSPSAPTADKPRRYFGWVMRTDLDGFTARVEQCFDDDAKLQGLASSFYRLMDAATQFINAHSAIMAQLPWAGDNFTAVAVFDSFDKFDAERDVKPIELALDFEKEMDESATASGFGGWAYGIAGGEVHGNSGGNVFLGSVLVKDRRFLVGAGDGFGRSSQVFGDINPKAGEIGIYCSDWEHLDPQYKSRFEAAKNNRGEESSLFVLASTQNLKAARAEKGAGGSALSISIPHGRSQRVEHKPYSS